jgi:flagellar biosynthetic protein FlhB
MQATVNVLDDIFDLVIQMSLVFVGLAVADYLYQRWDYEKNIKMTKQELKEEFKETEGNPETKSRIRQLQRSLSRQRMMQQVPTADVIVRNPTHFAVALRYRPDRDEAPVVVAKGQDRIAFKIIEIAEQYRIPMKEDRPLARALYAAVKVDQPIPPEFYAPLASIMAWVFRQRKKEMKR